LLGQVGSDVVKGNLLVVPIEDSLLYVQPIYLAADTATGGIPQFKRVVASYNSQIEIADSLDKVLFQLFGDGTGGGDPDDGVAPPPDGSVEEQVAELLARAEVALEQADIALRAGDLAGYQAKVDEARGYIEDANQIIADAAAEISGESASLDL